MKTHKVTPDAALRTVAALTTFSTGGGLCDCPHTSQSSPGLTCAMPQTKTVPPPKPPSLRDAGPRPVGMGIMLRAVGGYDGAGVYIRKLMDALLELDRRNEYVLFYASQDQLGTYAGRPNVLEVVVRAPGKFAWDQVAVPLAARRAGLDVLFHHKFS